MGQENLDENKEGLQNPEGDNGLPEGQENNGQGEGTAQKSDLEILKEKMEQMAKDLAVERANSKKWKGEFDKASSQISAYKARAKTQEELDAVSAAEKAAQEEAQKQYVKGLEDFKQKHDLMDMYRNCGLSAELCEQAADAYMANDNAKVASIFAEDKKNAVAKEREEWLKNRPDIRTGSAEKPDVDPMLAAWAEVPYVYGTKK